MSLYSASVEYALHCMLHLVDVPEGTWPSTRDVAEFQGVSPTYVAKLFTKLQKAGLVTSAEGIGGGFRLAKAPGEISVLDIADAVEGYKPLFNCREIRRNCILYGDNPPRSATEGVCQIHAAMLDAEARMRDSLAATSLADLAGRVNEHVPGGILAAGRAWFEDRQANRRSPGRPRRDS